MPPASSHLADRPVPAPPPTMGWPLRILSRNLFKMVSRFDSDMETPSIQLLVCCRHDITKGIQGGGDELGAVDVMRYPNQAALVRLPDMLLQRIEQGLIS